MRLLAEGARVWVADLAPLPDDLHAAGVKALGCDMRDKRNVEDAVAQLIGRAASASSKGGVVQSTKAAALDAAQQRFRVNCICPCFVETSMVSDWLARQPEPEDARLAAVLAQPIGRLGQPHEIAATIAWLGSHQASFVTGHALPVDGGTTAE